MDKIRQEFLRTLPLEWRRVFSYPALPKNGFRRAVADRSDLFRSPVGLHAQRIFRGKDRARLLFQPSGRAGDAQRSRRRTREASAALPVKASVETRHAAPLHLLHFKDEIKQTRSSKDAKLFMKIAIQGE